MSSEPSTRPYLRDLSSRGFVQGVTYFSNDKPLCHYFGGIPYAVQPAGASRWKKSQPLDPKYSYGTEKEPGKFAGKTAVCPQPGYGSVSSEDCFQLNVWIPLGDPPEGGWPVLFYIHGGFLQTGSANDQKPVALISETSVKAVIISPGYRLNIFGFLASPDLIAAGCDPNCGFWDQRLALEWTYENITHFGGDPSNITISGYSAGAHSAFHQLAFDLYQPPSKQLVKRVIMWSNSPGLQPRSLASAQQQFNELLGQLNIPSSLSPTEKLGRLQSLTPEAILAPVNKVQSKVVGPRTLIHHQYRAVTDGSFVRKTLFSDINKGVFARRLKERGIRILIGECRDEHFLYALWHAPTSFQGLFTRLLADYPEVGVRAVVHHYCPDGKLPARYKSWQDFFGYIYADVQVHLIQRGFLNQLARHGAGDLVYRYRVEWRASCVTLPPEWGVTHTSDVCSIWFFGDGQQLAQKEQQVAKKAYLDTLARYIRGEEIRDSWGTDSVQKMRRLRSDGTVDRWNDERWSEGVQLWQELSDAGALGNEIKAKL